jgi:hypothetical protein
MQSLGRLVSYFNRVFDRGYTTFVAFNGKSYYFEAGSAVFPAWIRNVRRVSLRGFVTKIP